MKWTFNKQFRYEQFQHLVVSHSVTYKIAFISITQEILSVIPKARKKKQFNKPFNQT